ncbi:LAO/AO transport system kinase [Limimaricola soesokkakensis]|uniref:LAO/AO transport system kinase n=1 Tax=Limimaricola soesokkakensis TaxID=1343159 RepID=A0A1X6YVM3_9RHOB|nr:methylmalonyl Co-A mutase-associated GTPase MeaB [Limimaricola soesokkakensis]PSK87662.1 LAO/AO transport system kinase [Limimaricola soesokkakensis]SLN32880.1 putative GTPase ArgK [Limimaricola soesokkakensis]
MSIEIEDLATRLVAGERRALARAITLVESTRADHRAAAEALLDRLADPDRTALRVGLSGTPGVGKSSFIEALGLRLVADGHRVAVLAVDPSSARSGGSILGDKTRMERLSREARAFIRPSPAAAQLGGVARRTREAMLLCEAAGFDVVIVETVGVGQSETLVSRMTDVFLLLLAPAGGDELQGVKRGIMEIADLVLVNKADGDLAAQAQRTRADYAGALRLMRRRDTDPEGIPAARTVSALTGGGLAEAWAEVERLARWRRDSGVTARVRAAQAGQWFEDELRAGLEALLASDSELAARLERLRAEVETGRAAPGAAARAALDPLVRALRDA